MVCTATPHSHVNAKYYSTTQQHIRITHLQQLPAALHGGNMHWHVQAAAPAFMGAAHRLGATWVLAAAWLAATAAGAAPAAVGAGGVGPSSSSLRGPRSMALGHAYGGAATVHKTSPAAEAEMSAEIQRSTRTLLHGCHRKG